MIELYIDGNKVVLPDNFNAEIIEENPVYTKNGKYTYDIELSLNNAVNTKIYKHFSRFNNDFPLFQNRSAVLIVDNLVELNGTEVILSVDNNVAKIQLVSGNSELNFLVGGNKKIRDLNMGEVAFAEESTEDPDSVYYNVSDPFYDNDYFSYLSLGYPAKNFVIAPFYSNDQNLIFNRYIYYRITSETGTTIPRLNTPKQPRPQPYFAAIIDKLIASLSYTLVENAIGNHSVFKYYYIVHGYYTMEYAKMLPDWTVNEFLSKIEKQFNCTFIVDENTKTVKLLFNNSHELSEPNYISVFDDYICEIDTENNIDVSNANIEYDLESNDINKYAKLEKNIFDYAIKDTYTTLLNLAFKITSDTNRLKKIYQGVYGDFIVIPVGESDYEIKKVNQFKNLYQNDSEKIDETFDLVPVPMKAINDYVLKYPEEYWYFYNQYPVIYNTELASAVVSDDFILSDILDGKAELPKNDSNSKIFLAMYYGLQSLDWVDNSPSFDVANFPTPFVEAVAEYFNVNTLPRIFYNFDVFRLKWMADNIYSHSSVDTTKKYRIRFFKKNNLIITNPFIAKNKKFVCVKYQKKVNKDGFSNVFEGDFYPVN